MNTLLILHLGSTLFMTGLIWFVQVVHYPLFAQVPDEYFLHYEKAHQRRTTFVVGPPMLLEGATSVALFVDATSPFPPLLTGIGCVLNAILICSTAFLQMPAHHSLAKKFTARAHSDLVRTNWIRTAGWSVRSVLVLLLATQYW